MTTLKIFTCVTMRICTNMWPQLKIVHMNIHINWIYYTWKLHMHKHVHMYWQVTMLKLTEDETHTYEPTYDWLPNCVIMWLCSELHMGEWMHHMHWHVTVCRTCMIVNTCMCFDLELCPEFVHNLKWAYEPHSELALLSTHA